MSEPAAAHRPPRASNEQEHLLIAGLGNPMMTDDGIGHEVLRRLKQRALPSTVRLQPVDGDVLMLARLWNGEPSIWLVDAVSGGSPAGSLHVYRHHELLRLPAGGLSTHHLTVAEGLRWMLHTWPEMKAAEFRLYGVEVSVVRSGRGLTSAVEQGVSRLVDEICTTLERWTA